MSLNVLKADLESIKTTVNQIQNRISRIASNLPNDMYSYKVSEFVSNTLIQIASMENNIVNIQESCKTTLEYLGERSNTIEEVFKTINEFIAQFDVLKLLFNFITYFFIENCFFTSHVTLWWYKKNKKTYQGS